MKNGKNGWKLSNKNTGLSRKIEHGIYSTLLLEKGQIQRDEDGKLVIDEKEEEDASKDEISGSENGEALANEDGEDPQNEQTSDTNGEFLTRITITW